MTRNSAERPIAIVCAMEWELAHFRRRVSASADGPCTFLAELEGHPLVLAYCGMGMVSAAAATQSVISRNQPRLVLNYGCAGAHRAELLPGDIVVGSRVVAYDNIRETPSGEAQYSGMPYLAHGNQCRVDTLEADVDLLAAAHRVAEDQVEAWPKELGWPDSIQHRAARVAFGTVASADRWNRSPATILRLVELHDSLCEDMEAAAIGLVCLSNGVPFLAIKDISNNELLRATRGGEAMLQELGADQLARRAAAFAFGVVRELTPRRSELMAS